jgi:Tfp pilus assembly PilM family ATPase
MGDLVMLEKSLVGIYLSDEAITGVCVKKDKKQGKWRYKMEFHHPLSPGLVTNGQIARPEELPATIKPILSQYKLAGTRVNFLADTSSVINRLVTMPIISDCELKEAVYWEIKPFLTYDIEEIFFDYVVLQQNKEEQLQQVYIAALAKKQAIDYVHFLKEVGLTPWRIESKWMVLFRLWGLMEDETWKNNQQDGLTCLFLVAKGTGQFVVRDSQQGFAVRQVLFQDQAEVEKIIQEYSQISFYLQGKYQKKLKEIKVIGNIDHFFLNHLANEGIEVTVIERSALLNHSLVMRETGEHLSRFEKEYLADLAFAFGLVLGEVSNEA